MVLKDCACEEGNFQPFHNGICACKAAGCGMVAFYEKNGYHQTHIEPEKEGMDMVYMKN